jgi:hypothetical protein
MEVHVEFLPSGGRRQDAETVINDATITTHNGNFRQRISQRMDGGNELVIDGFDIALVGGRKSIVEAFCDGPCARWMFSAPHPMLIYASHERSAARRQQAFEIGVNRIVQIATGPVYNAGRLVTNNMRIDREKRDGNEPNDGGHWQRFGENYRKAMHGTYQLNANKNVFRVLGHAMKKKTLLYLFAANQNFTGHALCTRANGAQLSQLIRQYFGI